MREKVFTNKSENNNFNPFARKLIGITAASAVFFLPVACKSAEDGGASTPYNASCLDELNKDSDAHKLVNVVDIDHSELMGGTDEQYSDALYTNIMHTVNYPGSSIDKTNSQQDNELRQSLDNAVGEMGQQGNWIEIIAYPRESGADIHDDMTELERDSNGMRQFQIDPDAAYCVNIKK